MLIGERIKQLRKERKLTQKQLAERAGIATSTLQQYEANEYAPKIEQVGKLADALGVHIFDLSDLDKYTTSDYYLNSTKVVVQDWLASLGYKVEYDQEDAGLFIDDLSSGFYYEIRMTDLDELVKNIESYSRFQVQELLKHCRALPKQPSTKEE